MNFYSFLQLIRWKNLVILATTLLVIKFGFINIFTDNSSLDLIPFTILLLSNLLIAAAGYIINDIYDTEIDQINKPKKVSVGTIFTLKQSYNYYFLLNILGVLMGFYIANYLNQPVLASIPIGVSFLLYYYSKTLKKLPFIGNITVAFFISLSILTLAFFDLILIDDSNILGFHYLLFDLLVDFSIFAFLINLTREIIKDIEDIKGDKQLNINTLPILIGVKYSKLIIAFFVFILMIALAYFMINYLQLYSFIFYYFLVVIVFPLLYFIIKLYNANNKSDFNLLSKVLKIIMLSGILSILLISLSVKNVF